jgi:hypothetical protein
MMLAGCFGMLAATGDVLLNLKDEISSSLQGKRSVAPWDAG